MASQDNAPDLVVPVISEELHADAVPVTTGSVRVVKRVEGHEEILEQELRRGRVEVKRVKTNRVVDGPQDVQRNGRTMVIPVVSEVLRVTKEWVVTEEIHITQIEDTERVQERVSVNREIAEVERVDEAGNIVRQTVGASASVAAASADSPARTPVATTLPDSPRPSTLFANRKSIVRKDAE